MLVGRLGLHLIDSVNVLTRAHYLPAFGDGHVIHVGEVVARRGRHGTHDSRADRPRDRNEWQLLLALQAARRIAPQDSHGPRAMLAVVGAVAIPAAVALATDRADALLVVLPGEGLPRNMPEGAGLIEWNGWTAVIAGGKEGVVRAAYAAGALLVLPARKSSCVDFQAIKS